MFGWADYVVMRRRAEQTILFSTYDYEGARVSRQCERVRNTAVGEQEIPNYREILRRWTIIQTMTRHLLYRDEMTTA